MKKKKLVKLALKNPGLYTPAELAYFQCWLRLRKERKKAAKMNLNNKEDING
jgi:hypothetical protein